MSVVACRILPGGGYEMASDSIVTFGWTQSRGDNAKQAKMWEGNDLVIGAAGRLEDWSLFCLFASTRRPASSAVRDILEFVSEFSDWKKAKTEKPWDDYTSLLIGFGGKVSRVCAYDVTEVTKYEAIGAGMDFALAALWMGHSAEDAVKCAIELCVLCEGPVRVIRKEAAHE